MCIRDRLVYRTDTFARGGGNLHDAVAGAFVHGMKVCDGLRVLQVSSATGEGVGAVHELLKGRTTLVSGNSGVGKSTLIRAIDPSLDVYKRQG